MWFREFKDVPEGLRVYSYFLLPNYYMTRLLLEGSQSNDHYYEDLKVHDNYYENLQVYDSRTPEP